MIPWDHCAWLTGITVHDMLGKKITVEDILGKSA